jgi:hypothetical protein
MAKKGSHKRNPREGRPPEEHRENAENAKQRTDTTGYDLERRYEDAYLRNKENWDNPNSATSMNSPVWNDEDNWDPPGPLAGKDPEALTRPDSAIRAQINDRLALEAPFDTKDIEVTVKNHQVTLSGTIHSKKHRHLVEEIANSVSGIEAVQNNLAVS